MKGIRFFFAWLVITATYVTIYLALQRGSTIGESLLFVGGLNLFTPFLSPILILCFLSPKFIDDHSQLRSLRYEQSFLSSKRFSSYRLFKSSKFKNGIILFPRPFAEHFVVASENVKILNLKLNEKVYQAKFTYYFLIYYFFPLLLTFALIASFVERCGRLITRSKRSIFPSKGIIDFLLIPYFFLIDGEISNPLVPDNQESRTVIKFFNQEFKYQRIDI